jgi:cytochrome c biogenesis protein CcdA
MNPGSVGFGFLAGVVSVLSPCVLPILPLILAAAAAVHRAAVLCLAFGMAIAFVVAGLFIATIGIAIGIDGDALHFVSALLLGAFGLVLLLSDLQAAFARAAGPIGAAGNRMLARVTPSGVGPSGLGGQFVLGLILGAAWSPCVGPTLGAASMLAAQGRDLPGVAVVMLAFGLGAALPLLVLGSLSRAAMLRWRGPMRQLGRAGNWLVGGVSVAVAVLILSGLDRTLEVALVEASPDWLTALTTRF